MKRLAFPVKRPIWRIAEFKAERSFLHALLGAPHHTETDPSRTAGGDEDSWAFETESSQRIAVLFAVPYKHAVVFCDPPDAKAALGAIADPTKLESLRIITPPIEIL